MKPIERATKIVGGQSELARRIGGDVKQAHVWNWINKSDGVVPAEHCRAIEDATDGMVTRYELRPDVFGPSPDAANEPAQQQAWDGDDRREQQA